MSRPWPTPRRRPLDTQAKAATALLDAVRRQGVAEADIRAESVCVNPVHDPTDGASRLRGCQAARTFSVTTREVGRTGAVLQAITDAAGEAGRVDSVNSGVSDPAPLPARARLAAHEDAHTKALQYARLSGHRLEPPGLPRPGRDRLSAPGPTGRRRGIGRCPRGAGRHPRDGDGRVRARLSGSANPAEPYPNPTGVGLSAPGRSTSMLPARVPGPAPPPPIAAHGPGTPHRRRT
ncbi:SIMPL domain-containing protein [Streptomyces bobili]|uniref:SIMPL domain-containing protein n=1 Tax=Streptomyces bobili TaxID=67280 RepID=UPI0033BB2583